MGGFHRQQTVFFVGYRNKSQFFFWLLCKERKSPCRFNRILVCKGVAWLHDGQLAQRNWNCRQVCVALVARAQFPATTWFSKEDDAMKCIILCDGGDVAYLHFCATSSTLLGKLKIKRTTRLYCCRGICISSWPCLFRYFLESLMMMILGWIFLSLRTRRATPPLFPPFIPSVALSAAVSVEISPWNQPVRFFLFLLFDSAETLWKWTIRQNIVCPLKEDSEYSPSKPPSSSTDWVERRRNIFWKEDENQIEVKWKYFFEATSNKMANPFDQKLSWEKSWASFLPFPRHVTLNGTRRQMRCDKWLLNRARQSAHSMGVLRNNFACSSRLFVSIYIRRRRRRRCKRK